MAEMLIAMAPLLLLVVALLLGRYPGCDAIVGLSERLTSEPRRRTAMSAPQPRLSHVAAASGGLLIALRIAKRPPPLAA